MISKIEKKAKTNKKVTPIGPRIIKENIFDVVMPWKKEKTHYNKSHTKGPDGMIIHQENVLKYNFEGIRDLQGLLINPPWRMNLSGKDDSGADWLFDENDEVKCKEEDVTIR